jgi:hypothetical protein
MAINLDFVNYDEGFEDEIKLMRKLLEIYFFRYSAESEFPLKIQNTEKISFILYCSQTN